MVLRHRVRGGDRLAGHRLGREPVLINNGADVYNEWVNHEIPFNDPRSPRRCDQMDELLLADGRTNGGRQSIASNNFNTAANPMFDDPPGCFMYRQGNFVAQEGGFPDEVLADLDNTVGVFPMPGKTADDKPVLGGGDLAGIFAQDNESAQKLIKFLASVGLRDDGVRRERQLDLAADRLRHRACTRRDLRAIATVAYESTDFVFDGSDQMPGEVGSGSFWREMAAWISGGQDTKTTLDNIEDSWPA